MTSTYFITLIVLTCYLVVPSFAAVGDNCTVSTVNTDCNVAGGEVCGASDTCECNGTSHYLHDLDSTCKKKGDLGGTCTTSGSTNQCLDSDTHCVLKGSDLKCRCTANFYDSDGDNSNVGGECLPRGDLGGTCTTSGSTNQCLDSDTHCVLEGSDLKCRCTANYYDSDGDNSNVGGECLPKGDLGGTCTTSGSTNQCLDSDTHCVLEGSDLKCRCTANYYDSDGDNSNVGGECLPKGDLGGTCTTSGSTNQCLDSDTHCVLEGSDLKCRCTANYYDSDGDNSNVGGECLPKGDLGGTCTTSGSTNQCLDSDTHCVLEGSDLKCRCTANFYDSDGDNSNVGGECLPKGDLGGICTTDGSTNQCLDSDTHCVLEGSDLKCRCTANYYDKDGDKSNVGGECLPKGDLGGTCTTDGSTNQCLDSDTHCVLEGSDLKCRCTANYYDSDGDNSNVGGECLPKGDLGGACITDGSINQCLDSNTLCVVEGSDLKCRCTANYYDSDGDNSNVGGECLPKGDLGGACTTSGSTNQCLDSDTHCVLEGSDLKCRCTANYYDSDGDNSNEGGECLPKGDLGGACTTDGSTNQCLDSDTHCVLEGSDLKCRCTANYYDSDGDNSNVGGECLPKGDLGGTCTTSGSTNQCLDSDTHCVLEGSDLKCRCTANYYDSDGDNSNVGGECLPKGDLGGTCTTDGSTNQCLDSDTHCVLEGSDLKCRCTANYYDSDGDNSNVGGECLPKGDLGGTCTTSGSTNQCLDSDTHCVLEGSDLKCRCTANYYDSDGDNSNVGGECLPKGDLGGTCTTDGSTNQCLDSDTHCVLEGSDLKCRCTANYYDSDGDNSNVGGECLPKGDLGGTCTTSGSTNQCLDSDTHCELEGSDLKCRCTANFYDSDGDNSNVGGECLPKGDLGGTCTTDGSINQCLDSNTQCVSEGSDLKCRCTANFYDSDGDNSNVGGECLAKGDLGGTCTTDGSTNQCLDSNTQCVSEGSDLKCRCTANFYDSDGDNSNVGGECRSKSALGQACINGDPPAQCSVTNSECIADTNGGTSYKCLCKAGFYANSASCNDLNELQVGNLAVPDDTTRETLFLVTWTNPVNVGYINTYQLDIIYKGITELTKVINKTKSEYNVTGRVAGRKYTIQLTSIETASRPTQQTVTASVIDGCKPATPGNIIGTVFNAPSVSLSWNITGDIESLSGSVNDSNVSPPTFNRSSSNGLSPTVMFSSLLPGKRYIFTVTAHSNGLSSNAKTETIRTTPTQPGPPLNFACVTNNIYDRSITLTWNKPTSPNGDIQHYIVYDRNSNTQFNTNGSVMEQEIKDLTPETTYFFSIATVNDATTSISIQVNNINCRTRTALSTPPRNLEGTVTHNTLSVTWDSPLDPGGSTLGYRLTVRNETDPNDIKCVKEILLKCDGCIGSPQGYTYTECSLKETVLLPQINMTGIVSYTISGLNPYVKYDLKVQAVNARGDGNPVDLMITTLQTVPLKPASVQGTGMIDGKIQLSWLQPLPRPGITNYSIEVYEANDENTDFVLKPNFGKTITGFYTQSSLFEGLEEYWEYKFIVESKTSIGSNRSDQSDAIRTLAGKPGAVVDFGIGHPQGVYTQMEVKWSIPAIRDRNGVIKEYHLVHNISAVDTTVVVSQISNTDTYQQVFNVTTETFYAIKVFAVNTDNLNGDIVNEVYFANPGPPIVPDIPAIPDESLRPVTTQTSISLKFNLDWFLNTENGQRTDGGVIVCPGDNCPSYGAVDGQSMPKSNGHFLDKSLILTWKMAKKEGFRKPYRVTNTTWVDDHYQVANNGRRKRSSHNVVELVAGEDKDCDERSETEYCNGPLPAGSKFVFVAFVCSAGGCSESDLFGPFATQAVPEKDDTLIPIIAGVVAAAVVFIIVIVIIIVIKKHRGKSGPSPGSSISSLCPFPPDEPHDNIVIKRPVKLCDFHLKIAELHKDSNLKFAHEYEELKVLTDPKTMKGVAVSRAEMEDNKLKNRYVNILPYDHSIVKLLPLEDDDGDSSTFINANYVPGYASQREYIACQGPLPCTIDDFWRMVWEQNVHIIVMLTLCKEDGRQKCELYWPMESNEAKQYGDIVVQTINFSNINTYEQRIFKISVGEKSRTVKHFHFLQWRDFSADVKNDVLVDFIQNVRSHASVPEKRTPMVIHCSAGVGRTGTYIALDHLMQFINEHDFESTIDIFNMVYTMRKNRCYMVQTEQQYIFIHDCVQDMIEKKRQRELDALNGGDDMYGNTIVDNIYENKAFDADEPELYQNVDLKNQPKTTL